MNILRSMTLPSISLGWVKRLASSLKKERPLSVDLERLKARADKRAVACEGRAEAIEQQIAALNLEVERLDDEAAEAEVVLHSTRLMLGEL